MWTNPGPSDPTTKAALQVLTAPPYQVASQVGRIAAPSGITLTRWPVARGDLGTTDRAKKASWHGAVDPARCRTYDDQPRPADRGRKNARRVSALLLLVLQPSCIRF